MEKRRKSVIKRAFFFSPVWPFFAAIELCRLKLVKYLRNLGKQIEMIAMTRIQINIMECFAVFRFSGNMKVDDRFRSYVGQTRRPSKEAQTCLEFLLRTLQTMTWILMRCDKQHHTNAKCFLDFLLNFPSCFHHCSEAHFPRENWLKLQDFSNFQIAEGEDWA